MALTADSGNLDPQASAASVLFQTSHVAYDSLVGTDPDGGGIASQLADGWKVDGQQVTLTLRDGITCSDGSPFTAEDVAANLNYVADCAGSSPFLAVFVPAGATATVSGSTVTMALASPARFVLEGLSSAPVVCRSGMANRSVLARDTRGTGPYRLQEAARVQVSGGANPAPLETTASASIFARVVVLARERGLPELGAATVEGPSDGNFTAGVAVPTLDGLGATGGGAHSDDDEHLLVSERAALAADLPAGLRPSTATNDVPSFGVHRP